LIEKNLMREAIQYKALFFGSVAAGLLSAVGVLGHTYYVAKIIDGAFLKDYDLATLRSFFAPVIIFLIIRCGFEYLESYLSLTLSRNVQNNLRNKIIEKPSKLSPIQIQSMPKGQIMNLLYDGVDNLEEYFSGYMPQLFKAVFVPIIFLIIIMPRDLISGLIMVVTIPLIPFFMVLIGKWTKRSSVRQWVLLTGFASFLQDVLAGLETLKILGRSKKQGERIDEISEAYRETTFNVQKLAFISSLTLELVATISIAMVAVGLGVRLSKGMLDFLIAFHILLLAPEYYQPMRTLGRFFHSGINASEASKSIFEFLETESLYKTSKNNLKDVNEVKNIRFENVSFSYPDSEENAIKDITFTFNVGEKIAFVGPSGSGKSTLMMLALGFLSPTEGNIYINDIPIDEININVYRDKIAAVLQDPYIFRGSVIDNIIFSDFDKVHDDDEIKRAKEIADGVGLTKLLEMGGESIDTKIGKGYVTLSGGQSALLHISRALYHDGDVMFFDEMTENLDLNSEKILTEVFENKLSQKSMWMIAHRLQSLKHVDKIYHMEDGRISKIEDVK